MNDSDDPKITPFPSRKERESLEKARFVHTPKELTGEPAFNLPFLVRSLCLINLAVFLVTTYLPQVVAPERVYDLSFVPARYFNAEPLTFAAVFSPLTHMFMHAGWMHIGINMGMLMAFGTGLENRLGARRLLLFYLATGLCGAAIHALAYSSADVPMLGASGAVSGLFGGILMLMYEQGMMGQGYRKLLPLILVWIGISVFFGLVGMPGVDNPIAWTTHIGGFVAGLLLYKPIARLKL